MKWAVDGHTSLHLKSSVRGVPRVQAAKEPRSDILKGTPQMIILMRLPAVTSFLLIIACICVICINLSTIFCLSFCLTVHYHVVNSDKEEIKIIYKPKFLLNLIDWKQNKVSSAILKSQQINVFLFFSYVHVYSARQAAHNISVYEC